MLISKGDMIQFCFTIFEWKGNGHAKRLL